MKVACETGMACVRKRFCRERIKTGQVCEEHTGLYDTWNPDERQCNQCAEYSFNGEMVSCTRFRCLLTCSDMDKSYAKFGIQIAQQFDTALNDEDESFGPPSIHINDIGHNIKNAEASLERGMHWNGSVSYDANDLAIMLASPPSGDVYIVSYAEEYHIQLFANLIHTVKNLALQRILKHVTESCEEVAELVKTDIPELRKPHFAENHDDVGKPIFVDVGMKGAFFFTDAFSNAMFSMYLMSQLISRI